MKIIATYFKREEKYERLLSIFEKSARAAMPGVELDVQKIKLPEYIDHQRDTAFSFLAAAERVIELNEPVAVTGIDSLFLKSLEDIRDYSFDIAITVRNRRVKYNTGIWFYRPSGPAKHFVKKWISQTKRLMKHFDKYREYISCYGGIDQASLNIVLEKNRKAVIRALHCHEWNSTQSEWQYVDENTKMVHVKSKLRQIILNDEEIPENMSYLKPIAEKIREYL